MRLAAGMAALLRSESIGRLAFQWAGKRAAGLPPAIANQTYPGQYIDALPILIAPG
jgi:hypothetical protein